MISLAGVTRPLAAARYAVCKTHEHLDTLRPRERAVRSLTSARRQAPALPADARPGLYAWKSNLAS